MEQYIADKYNKSSAVKRLNTMLQLTTPLIKQIRHCILFIKIWNGQLKYPNENSEY
jgi:hypothetical protein